MVELANESVHCVVTSPPYWGLRKYSGEQDLIWGGDKKCEHQWLNSTRQGISGGKGNKKQETNPASYFGVSLQGFCSLCGAWKGSLGLEPEPSMYIKHIVDIFKEVKRVLRSDGVCFINIGDSYWAGGQGGNTWGGLGSVGVEDFGHIAKGKHPVIKPQDKCLIPFRLAIALQEDGWWIRQDIVWQKNNPMPESVSSPRWVKHRIKIGNLGRGKGKYSKEIGCKDSPVSESIDAVWQDCHGCEKCLPNDGLVLRHGSWRPTESHEYILMLTKSNDYYCDGEAVREGYAESTFPRMLRGVGNHKYVGVPEAAGGGAGNQPRSNIRKAFEDWHYDGQATKDYDKDGVQNPSDTKRRIIESIKKNESGRNLRSVWEFPTQSYGDQMCLGCGTGYTSRQYRRFKTIDKKKICPKCGSNKWVSHYATFPEKLPELCIKAGTSEWGVCAECGKPWARILKSQSGFTDGICNICGETRNKHIQSTKSALGNSATMLEDGAIPCGGSQTLGWKATCKCKTDKVIPATVLDPFCGTGTTLYVASKLGRRSTGYELSEDYCNLTVERNKQGVLTF